MPKQHFILKNPIGVKNAFDASRGRDDENEDESTVQKNYSFQKNKFATSLANFQSQRIQRIQQRVLDVPAHLEFIKIHFFIIFNNNDEFRTKDRFYDEFGLTPILYENFNQTVLFVITDSEKFSVFVELMQTYISSPADEQPSNKPYAVLTTIVDFAFLSTAQLIKGDLGSDVILSLIYPDEEILPAFERIRETLISYLRSLKDEVPALEIGEEFFMIELKNIGIEQITLIAQNFDIIHSIQTLRTVVFKPSEYNTNILSWDFIVRPPENGTEVIGVLDNGVSAIDPIRGILVTPGIDITNKAAPDPLRTAHPHGTSVATLAAVGTDFFDSAKKEFTADAYIMPIKILNNGTDAINIYEIAQAILEAVKRGVRIFNLSVVAGSKNYNAPVSEYAYLLDRLTFLNNILIFISTGNLAEGDINAMIADLRGGNNTDLHQYPYHFYNPHSFSIHHTCECSNLCAPGESFNNVTVGALADNLNQTSFSDLTADKQLPAFYTRKHHLDYAQKVNESDVKLSQQNYNINKPDIVMPGGDLLDIASMMQVLGLGLNGNDYYSMESGTSLAAPLAANLAAKIRNIYSDLRMETVKCLILNSAREMLKKSFLDDLIKKVQNDMAVNEFNTLFDNLNPKRKTAIRKKVKTSTLYKRLIGFGKPDVSKALYSDDDSVTIIVEDTIQSGLYKVININIPDYLLQYDKTSPVLKVKATICFKFPPVWNDHLGYNPVHISFNFFKSLVIDNPGQTADILSDNKHAFYEDFYEPETGDKKVDDSNKTKARNKLKHIKGSALPWSEDFYPPSSKPFSNVQQLGFNISKEEIIKMQNQFSLTVRCITKHTANEEFNTFLQNRDHAFSIVINIEDKSTGLSDFSLYDELMSINELEQIGTLQIEQTDLEAEAEAE